MKWFVGNLTIKVLDVIYWTSLVWGVLWAANRSDYLYVLGGSIHYGRK